MKQLSTWVRQPTTIAGISALFGTLVALALQQMGWAEAVPLLTGSAISMILPDNTAAKQQAVTVAADIVEQVTGQQGASK
jgi:hypothetical protein